MLISSAVLPALSEAILKGEFSRWEVAEPASRHLASGKDEGPACEAFHLVHLSAC
jgi:hypothetical protein